MTDSGRALAILLAAGQTVGVVWLVRLGLARGGRWASATFVTGAAWAPLFLAPCWIYAADPGLLKTTDVPAQPIAIVDVSLFALIAGVLIVRARNGAPSPPEVIAAEPLPPESRRALIGFAVFGIVCLGLLMARAGGPLAYVSSQYNSAQLNRGLLYLIWGVMFLRYAPLAAIASRWAGGHRAPRSLLVYLLVGCLIMLLLGARELIAVAAVQVLLTAGLIRKRIRLRAFVLPAVLSGLAIVFGLGAVKQYQAYEALHPHEHRGVIGFLTQVAPRQTLDDYVNNYVAGVSLLGTVRRIVPSQANYEYGRVLLQTLVMPIPSPVRPHVAEQPLVQATLSPPGGFTNAVPLQATAYLEFGIPGVVVTFVALGALLAAIDSRLAAPRRHALPTLLALISLAVQIPVLLRGGLPAGLVFLLIDVIGIWLAASIVGGRAQLRSRVMDARKGLRPSIRVTQRYLRGHRRTGTE